MEPEPQSVRRETLSADSNDGAHIPSPDAEPLYARQADADRPESERELTATPDLPLALTGLGDRLSRSVEDGGLLSYALADQFGALGHCDLCGRPILQVPAFAAALASHYEAPEETRLAFEDAIRRSTLEQANESTPNFCSYHGQITSE